MVVLGDPCVLLPYACDCGREVYSLTVAVAVPVPALYVVPGRADLQLRDNHESHLGGFVGTS